jgi:hypothetical protein
MMTLCLQIKLSNTKLGALTQLPWAQFYVLICVQAIQLDAE